MTKSNEDISLDKQNINPTLRGQSTKVEQTECTLHASYLL